MTGQINSSQSINSETILGTSFCQNLLFLFFLFYFDSLVFLYFSVLTSCFFSPALDCSRLCSPALLVKIVLVSLCLSLVIFIFIVSSSLNGLEGFRSVSCFFRFSSCFFVLPSQFLLRSLLFCYLLIFPCEDTLSV